MDLNSLRIVLGVVVVAGALTLIFLERRFPYTPGQRFFREGFWNDFFWYTLFQSFVMGLIISFVIEWIDGGTGLSRVTWIREWPLWVQLLLFIVTHDFYIYWFHRLQHSSAVLWRTHEAHHSVRDVDWIGGMRSHAVEIFINQTVEFVPLILLGSPEVAVLKGAVDALWGMYIHSNIDVRSGWLQYVINGPEMHRWHHADQTEAYNTNYSTKLAIWDWLFGTAFFPRNRNPLKYGLSDVDYPGGYFRQFLFMFRPFPKGGGDSTPEA